jgi:chromate reductase, NAD(P)H dehydrogenase (quinone)
MGSEMPGVNVAIVVGSNRRQSINRQLALALAKLGDGNMTAKIVQIDDLPLYNQDLEDPLPASVSRFKDEIARADGVLFVTPEHNRSIPAVPKNAIDWGSRPYGKNIWTGRPAAITGTSPGAIASAIAQQHLRQILGNQGMIVLGGEAYITFNPGLIDEGGAVSDPGTRAFLQAFVDRFAALVSRLSGRDTIERAA